MALDRNTALGSSTIGIVVRLALISLAAGIVMKAMGFTLENFFHRLNTLLRNIYDLGFGAIDWIVEYMLLGALVVVPVFLIARLMGAFRKTPE